MARDAATERGAGVFASAIGLLVLLMFLLFAVQLLFSLHASTVVTAVTNDAARRAASDGAPARAEVQADLVRNLGRMGERAEVTWEDDPDAVVLTVSVAPPRFVPPSLGGIVGIDRIERTVRVRPERFDGAGT